MKRILTTILVLTTAWLSCKRGSPVGGNEIEPRGWFEVSLDSTDTFDVSFLNASTGWISTMGPYDGGWRGRIAFTTDGGQTWDTKLILTEAFLYNVSFQTNQVGIAGSTNFYRSTDGGRTWTQTAGLAPRSIFAVGFVTTTIGWGVGNQGTIIKTSDGGQSWLHQVSGYPGTAFRGVSVIDENNALAVGDTVLIKTSDGGSNWTKVGVPLFSQGIVPVRYFDVKFTSVTTGWVVGEYRSILHTSDGGLTWTVQSPPPGGPIHSDACTSMDAVDSLISITVTSAGAILRTEDGGQTWKEQREADGRWLWRVQMVTSSVVYAVGSRGLILKTTSAGLP